MRTVAGCVLALSLSGCHCGAPSWYARDCVDRCHEPAVDQSAPEQAAPTPADALKLPQQPTPAEVQAKEEAARRNRNGWWGSFVARTTPANASKNSSRSSTKSTPAKDDSSRQLVSDVDRLKREKAALESQLSEETVRQTQQRLELEARVAVLQEQLRQQSALQQVMYQQAAVPQRAMPNYNGPMVSAGAAHPSLPQWPANPSMPSANGSAWSQPMPAWDAHAPAVAVPSSVETWPYSPQRR